MDTEYMLSTIDNPYNPFTQFEAWYRFDEDAGYHTCSLLARLSFTSDELSDIDKSQAIDLAIDEIVSLNVSGVHIKVTEDYIPIVKQQVSEV